MDKKGLKQAEIKNKVDWFFKSALYVQDKAKGFCHVPKTGSWRLGCLSPLLSQQMR